jgi:hypothetical protein
MTVSTAAAAKRSLKEVELIAAHIMIRPADRKRSWAVERIRIVADDGYLDDAEARRQIRNVLAGLDLAEQRRRADR